MDKLAGYDPNQLIGKDPLTILQMVLWGILPLVIAGVIILGVKYGYWGFMVLADNDRAIRERMGKAKKYFDKPGKVFYIKVFHWIRKANVAPQTMSFSILVNKGDIGTATGRFIFRIIDAEKHVKQAIYGLYDANRSDLQNDERINFIHGKVEGAITKIIRESLKKGVDPWDALTLKNLSSCCGRKLRRRAGTELIDFEVISLAPSGEQVEAKAKKDAANTLATSITEAIKTVWPTYPPAELFSPPKESNIPELS